MKNLSILFLLLAMTANTQCAAPYEQPKIDKEFPTTQAQRAQEFRNLCSKQREPSTIVWCAKAVINAISYPLTGIYSQRQERVEEYKKLWSVPPQQNPSRPRSGSRVRISEPSDLR